MNVDSLTRLGLYSGFYLFILFLAGCLDSINDWAAPVLLYIIGLTILGWFIKLYVGNKSDFLQK